MKYVNVSNIARSSTNKNIKHSRIYAVQTFNGDWHMCTIEKV